MKGEGEDPLKYTDWIYIRIPSIIIASLFTFATVDLNASIYVWIYGWAILCLLYPIQFNDVPKQ